jgi:hypothetical protein
MAKIDIAEHLGKQQHPCKEVERPVLATRHICPLNEASENAFPFLSHLSDSQDDG